VVGVVSGGAAARAGIEAGDLIVGIDGSEVATAGDLTAALQASRSGDQVEVTWQASNGRTRQSTIELQST
jgi:S1-C subfamily serine protease